MRRADRQVSEAEAWRILASAEHGVLATVGADGWPYAIAVNHVVSGDVLYIHSAPEGHKLENLAHDERVSYCAIASAKVVPEELTTLYESAVVFGRARVVTDPKEKAHALELLATRFCGSLTSETKRVMDGWFPRTAVVRIEIQRISGKAHRA